MKLAILVLSCFILLGCTSNGMEPAAHSYSLSALKKDCANNKQLEMRRAWINYEFHEWKEVHNGWRQQRRQWAQIECNLGQRVPAFWP